MRVAAMTAIALTLAFTVLASAGDVIYLHCPTVFTKSVSVVKANYFKTLAGASGPTPSCMGLNLSVDGNPAISSTCISEGLMSFNISTPVAKTYTITGVSTQGPPWNGDGTQATCTVRRSSFNVNVTIPDSSLLVLPLLGAAAVLLLRRAGRKAPKSFKP